MVLLLSAFSAQAQLKALQPDVWLRADKFDYKKKEWIDLSGHSRHASKVQGNYTFADSLINGNPAVYFNANNTALRLNYEPASADKLTVITVYQSADVRDQGVWRAELGSDYDAFLTTQRVMNLQNIRRYAAETTLYPVINTTVQSNDQPVKNLKGYIVIGGKDTIPETHIFKGKIAECIVFYRELSRREQQTVQSYLAMKYGVMLLFSDYVNGEGNTIWNYEQNKQYAYSVAAIGRDDATSLYQKQSSPAEQDGLVSLAATKFFPTNIQNTSVIDNNNFLLWSDNGQAMTFDFSRNNEYRLLNRHWLMTANGAGASSLITALKMNVKDFYTEEDSTLFLAVSREADEYFERAQYIPADSISADGTAYFGYLKWDTDRSGKDLFTFAVLNTTETVEPMNAIDDSQHTNSNNGEAFNGNQIQKALYDYKLWPNPTNGAYNLQLTYTEKTDVTVYVMTVSGTLLKQYSGKGLTEYYFSDFISQKGIFILRIETKAGVELMKIIVE